jgi:hypothetical protein
MQAIGEPALILFPFLFQGLVAQGEISLAPKQQANPRQPKDQVEDEQEESDKQGDHHSFQRIELTVPLPNIGPLDIMIAHRPGEILVRFTSETSLTKEFLIDNFPELEERLRDCGFTQTDLSVQTGITQNTSPTWCLALSKGTSFRA